MFCIRSSRAAVLALAGLVTSLAACVPDGTPPATTDPGAGPAAFAEALGRARPGELHTPPNDKHWQLHYAIFLGCHVADTVEELARVD